MEKTMLDYVHKKIIADVAIKMPDEDERILGRDAVMNVVGKYFVVMCGGKEVFREPHKNVEAYRMQSGNGMEFVVTSLFGKKKFLRVHFIQDVKTPKWHNETR